MMFNKAICRRPGPDFAGGLTSAGLGAPDYETALSQHAAYVQTLRSLGLEVDVLEALSGFPDACFVEDPAVVVPELAVLTRPGAASRRGEVASIGAALAGHRECIEIQPPGVLDGGDVLIVDKTVFVGLSARTNVDGVQQLSEALSPHGYRVHAIEVDAGLHLKSGVNWLGDQSLLLSTGFARNPLFAEYHRIVVDPDEDYACNTLWINETLITPAGFPRTRDKLGAMFMPVLELELGEFQKMDGGLTCLSLRF